MPLHTQVAIVLAGSTSSAEPHCIPSAPRGLGGHWMARPPSRPGRLTLHTQMQRCDPTAGLTPAAWRLAARRGALAAARSGSDRSTSRQASLALRRCRRFWTSCISGSAVASLNGAANHDARLPDLWPRCGRRREALERRAQGRRLQPAVVSRPRRSTGSRGNRSQRPRSTSHLWR